VTGLRAAGFKPTTTTKHSTTVAEGIVIGTAPAAGTKLPTGSAVTVLVSSGPAPVLVPDTIGQSLAGAEGALEKVGLAVGTTTQRVSAGETPGTVLSQSPDAGESLRAGGKVNLVLAQAPKEVAIPSVEGQKQAEAEAALKKAGFTVKKVSTPTIEPTQVGVVLTQSPAAGAHATKGATVTITVGVVAAQTTPTTPTTTPTTPAGPTAASAP